MKWRERAAVSVMCDCGAEADCDRVYLSADVPTREGTVPQRADALDLPAGWTLGHVAPTGKPVLTLAGASQVDLGWTRRRWVRARRAWNRERRRFPPRTLVAMCDEMDREMALAILGDLGRDLAPVVPAAPTPLARSFAEYVGRRLAEGRVSMRGRRS